MPISDVVKQYNCLEALAGLAAQFSFLNEQVVLKTPIYQSGRFFPELYNFIFFAKNDVEFIKNVRPTEKWWNTLF